ncbi:thiamine-phosphate kinase [Knoellia aerolata]|uniref:Thiamine-monophosphate kinase n=1 Tax=Knoellia aerolata DSM 18566 TaxID=1385519 RepID=A0A0A0JYY8_9MICO|nr:thiamine-phosphate kinase [Knoellia aerolata]KGN42675.1 thiamine monophosphate kinase [Knoellia aerolata DSM 18566]
MVSRATLASVSESELLGQILPMFGGSPYAGAGVLVPPGDDAAVITAHGSVVVTTDSMVRGRDWRDDWSSGHDVGVKVVAQNVADVAAMGAVPTGLLVSVAADPATELDWLIDLTRGIAAAAEDARCPVVGGDLSSAPHGVVVVGVTAFGDLQGRSPVLRSGARPGDVVAVAGSLGWSGAGLVLHEQGREDPITGEGRGRHLGEVDRAVSLLLWFHRSPRPPWESGPLAALAGATSMIDLSDGLVRDGARIATASGVELALDERALRRDFLAGPIEVALGADAGWPQVLAGGEEHSLLATFPQGGVPEDPSAPWTVIGTVLAAGPEGPRLTVGGAVPSVTGWDHFAG